MKFLFDLFRFFCWHEYVHLRREMIGGQIFAVKKCKKCGKFAYIGYSNDEPF